jgi:hypothetical protein
VTIRNADVAADIKIRLEWLGHVTETGQIREA